MRSALHNILLLALAFVGNATAQQLPVLPLSVATNPWPAAHSSACGGTDAFCGDIRVSLNVTQSNIIFNAGVVTAQVFWRRRDPNPQIKKIFVLDPTGAAVNVSPVTVEPTCGVFQFDAAVPGVYYAYYLPFHQGSGGADLTFSWIGCNSTDPTEHNPCVLGGASSTPAASVCDSATPAAAIALGLECRDAFNCFSVMEMMAAPAEASAAIAALLSQSSPPFVGVFPEDRDHSVRVRDGGIPVRWALAALHPVPFVIAGAPGEFLPFQLGVWAYAVAAPNITVASTAFTSPSSPSISPSDVAILSTGGSDTKGAPFTKPFGVDFGTAGSIWIGVQVPIDAQSGTLYSGNITIGCGGSNCSSANAVIVPMTLSVSGGSVPYAGAQNVSSLSRLSWLNSKRGLEDVVPAPFTSVTVTGGQGTDQPLVVSSLLKDVFLSATGLPNDIQAAFPTVANGVTSTESRLMLAEPVAFSLFGAGGSPFPVTPLSPAPTVAELLNSSVSWTASSAVSTPGGNNITMSVTGSLDFASYLTFAVTLYSPVAASISDARLSFRLNPSVFVLMAGMDQSGSAARNATWRWSNTTYTNRLFVGRPECGLVLDLRSTGDAWDSPMFGADFPIIPFVPNTWGGAAAAPTSNPYGVNISSDGRIVAFSGPRTFAAGESVTFLFNIALTPSKLIDWQKHWATRTFQVGYGTDYLTPYEVAARGVSVVTLHQGTPGIINGSLVNPYISYPFLPSTVELLANYTSIANSLGMATKFYYTIRELSTRAPETFAFLALDGEIFLDQDPYTVVQPGYSHAWNAHGGSAYLHQHAGSRYAACWQQQLSDGEWDPSLCDHGVSRLFNYYVEGLWWSMQQSPHINGVYYDGINFSRLSMARVRRVADAAAAASNSSFAPLLDLHSGRDPTPPAASYAGIYPFMNYVWNGEGFDFSAGPEYWLVETSSAIHGVTGDMLGGGSGSDYKGMLWGMTTRNSALAPEMWKMWDATRINATAPFGWWIDAPPVNATVVVSADACPTWNRTVSAYYESGTPCGNANGNEACFTDAALADAQAACCGDAACAGFSFGKSDGGGGCYKKSATCLVSNADYDGYWKPSFTPPPDKDHSRVLVTAYSAFGSHAVLVVASFRTAACNVTLSVDWARLGLSPGSVSVSAPAIGKLQPAQSIPDFGAPIELQGNGGIILFVTGSVR